MHTMLTLIYADNWLCLLDWNCPKYIPQMISAAKVNAFVESQLKQLTEENEALKAQLRKLQNQ